MSLSISNPLSAVRQFQTATVEKLSQGTASGKLTPGEAGTVMNGVQKLATQAKAAAADGKISLGEAVQLGQQKMQNAMTLKSVTNNNQGNSFAPFSPMAQNQARQLGGLAEGLKNGTINNTELRGSIQQQGMIANERMGMQNMGDAVNVLKDQKLSGLSLQLANLSGNGI